MDQVWSLEARLKELRPILIQLSESLIFCERPERKSMIQLVTLGGIFSLKCYNLLSQKLSCNQIRGFS